MARLLSALASQVTEAIFGANPQQAGTVQFGDGLRNRVAHTGDQLHGVLEELPLQVDLRVTRGDNLQHLRSPGCQITALWIDECDLPLHADGGLR